MLTSGHDAQFIFNDVVWFVFAKHFWLLFLIMEFAMGHINFTPLARFSFALQ
jgi:hypothetical protein